MLVEAIFFLLATAKLLRPVLASTLEWPQQMLLFGAPDQMIEHSILYFTHTFLVILLNTNKLVNQRIAPL